MRARVVSEWVGEVIYIYTLCCLSCLLLSFISLVSLHFPFPWPLVSLFSPPFSFMFPPAHVPLLPAPFSLLFPPFLPIASLLVPLFLPSVSSHPISCLLIFKDSHCPFTPFVFTLVVTALFTAALERDSCVFGVRSLILLLLTILFVHLFFILSLRCSSLLCWIYPCVFFCCYSP